jgi:hypothetical protein
MPWESLSDPIGLQGHLVRLFPYFQLMEVFHDLYRSANCQLLFANGWLNSPYTPSQSSRF